MGFLYFVENRNILSPATIAELGLDYALESCSQAECRTGPSDTGGVVATTGDTRCGYFPDSQTWKRHGGIPGVWFGWYASAKPPGPSQLARSEQLRGYDVVLGDGQLWQIPTARRFEEQGYVRTLPAKMRLDEHGAWVQGDVLPRYRKLWEFATKWFDFYFESAEQDVEIRVSFSVVCDWCAEALGCNYRVTRWEIDALGLLDQQNIYDVLDAVIDFPAFEAWQKKRAGAAG